VLAVAAARARGLRQEKRRGRSRGARRRTRRAAETLEGQGRHRAWPGYIERGETDKNYDWVTGVRNDTGCKVNIKTAGTSERWFRS